MGIDGIGGSGPPGVGGPKIGPASTGAEFNVGAAEAPRESAELQKLDAGEISLDQYLDGRATEAVAHLEGQLGPEQLAVVKAQLVEQMKSDPAISRLVQRATGVAQSALAGDSE